MNKNRKKVLKHKKKKEGLAKTFKSELEKIFKFYPQHEQFLELFQEVQKVDIDDFPKIYYKNPIFDFYAIMYAKLFEGHLETLRKLKGMKAGELDKLLGYSKCYPKATFTNMSNTPTSQNVKKSFEIFKKMAQLGGEKLKKKYISESELRYINISASLDRAFVSNGLTAPSELLKEQQTNPIFKNNEGENKKMEKAKQKMNEYYELEIDGEIVSFTEKDTAFTLIKKINENTTYKINVFETLREEINLEEI